MHAASDLRRTGSLLFSSQFPVFRCPARHEFSTVAATCTACSCSLTDLLSLEHRHQKRVAPTSQSRPRCWSGCWRQYQLPPGYRPSIYWWPAGWVLAAGAARPPQAQADIPCTHGPKLTQSAILLGCCIPSGKNLRSQGRRFAVNPRLQPGDNSGNHISRAC